MNVCFEINNTTQFEIKLRHYACVCYCWTKHEILQNSKLFTVNLPQKIKLSDILHHSDKANPKILPNRNTNYTLFFQRAFLLSVLKKIRISNSMRRRIFDKTRVLVVKTQKNISRNKLLVLSKSIMQIKIYFRYWR